MSFTYKTIHNSPLFKALSPAAIMGDKPRELLFSKVNCYNMIVAEIIRLKENDYVVTFKNNVGNYGSTTEHAKGMVEDHFATHKVHFKENKAYLVLNVAYSVQDRFVLMDYYSPTYDPEILTESAQDAFSTCGYHLTAIGASIDVPIVYTLDRHTADVDAFILMSKFNRLTYSKENKPTDEATKFMYWYFGRFYSLSPKTNYANLYLEERRDYKSTVPKYINTDLIEDMFRQFCFPGQDKSLTSGGIFEAGGFVRPSLADLVYNSGLTEIEKVTLLEDDLGIGEALLFLASKVYLYVYLVADSEKELDKIKKQVEPNLIHGVLKSSDINYIRVSKEVAKEFINVGV